MKEYASSFKISASFLVLLLLSTSCLRVGNNEVKNEPKESWDGLYELAPKSFKIFSSTTTQLKELALPVTRIPGHLLSKFSKLEMGAYLSNPVIFGYDLGSGTNSWLMAHIQAGSIFLVPFDEETGIIAGAGQSIATLWADPACQIKRVLEMTAEVQNGIPKTIGEYEAKGKISLDVQVTYVIDPGPGPQCDASLAAVATCYQTSSNCTSADHDEIVEIFGDVLNESLITSADFATLLTSGYSITY